MRALNHFGTFWGLKEEFLSTFRENTPKFGSFGNNKNTKNKEQFQAILTPKKNISCHEIFLHKIVEFGTIQMMIQ